MAAGNKNPHGAYLRVAQRREAGDGKREELETLRPRHPARARRRQRRGDRNTNPEGLGSPHACRRNCPNYRGDITHASLSHFLWPPEVREGKTRILRPQGNGTCAEALLMPRSPSASSLRIGRKLVSTQLPSDRSDNSAAPAGKR
ncbi:unnamed protein product [Rangifer tarandus platyrhynchus]|uniref:Uncharacterized protein n=1 Tax=Rangifer tarandus platyrhynchus TaxID=3082113 RepID=A0ABN8Y1X8_RANTA|nr:unnamed protein product [Rangifer tarandus platyrhynchus]